ncbi:hypothetical protein SAMN05216371_7119 [Streptomyces sp. TLI_053]|nr:hypothetical protein [Streptomyces sp. TLI_053]SDT82334.1 hypothetical protein SAMN05216371_7119 [Streptomyces sp. TLI_053]
MPRRCALPTCPAAVLHLFIRSAVPICPAVALRLPAAPAVPVAVRAVRR